MGYIRNSRGWFQNTTNIQRSIYEIWSKCVKIPYEKFQNKMTFRKNCNNTKKLYLIFS